MLNLVGCLYYLYQCCTVKKISDNEIYLLIKYIKNIIWRVGKRLSYIEDARCLNVKQKSKEKFRFYFQMLFVYLCFFIKIIPQNPQNDHDFSRSPDMTLFLNASSGDRNFWISCFSSEVWMPWWVKETQLLLSGSWEVKENVPEPTLSFRSSEVGRMFHCTHIQNHLEWQNHISVSNY